MGSNRKILRTQISYLCVDENRIWYIGSFGTWQGLFCHDIIDGKSHYLGEVPAKHAIASEYIVLERIGEKIIISPYFSRGDFLEYDLGERRFIHTGFRAENGRPEGTTLFTNSVRFGGSAFFLASSCGLIVEWRAGKYITHSEWANTLGVSKSKIEIGRYICSQDGDRLYFMIFGTNLLVELELHTMRARCHEIPFIKSAKNLLFHDGNLWIVPRYDEPYVYRRASDGKFFQAENFSDGRHLFGLSVFRGRIVTIPYFGREFYEFDPGSGTFSVNDELTKKLISPTDVSRRGGIFSFVTHPDESGRYFAFHSFERCLIEFRAHSGEVIRHPETADEAVQSAIWDYMKNTSAAMSEHYGIHLSDWLDVVGDTAGRVNPKKDESAGERICEAVLEGE